MNDPCADPTSDRAQDAVADRGSASSAGNIPLKGDIESWRIRVGDYRIVYTVHDGRLVVLVLSVAHRREVYRDL